MIPTRNLMIRLQERTNNLYSSPSGSLGPRLRHFVAWLDTEPFFNTTLGTLPMPEVDGDEWLREHLGRFEVTFPLYALTDYREIDRSIALRRAQARDGAGA